MAISGAKRKRVSKKTKLSWRKHTKLQDVEEFLEQKLEDERLGPSLTTVANEDLFIVDTKPQEQVISTRKSRKLRALKPLKCFSALVPHTKVPDPIAKRNRVRTPEERKSDFVKRKEAQGILKAKELTAISERRLYEIRKEKRPKRGDFNRDLWSNPNAFPIDKDEWAETNTKKHNLRGIGVSVKKNVQQKKKIPIAAVEPPHPGMSYNPSFKDHQDLLRTIAEKETKIIKEEKHINRVTQDMFRRLTTQRRDSEWLVEMSEGLPSIGNRESSEDGNLEDAKINLNPPVVNKKKTLQQRRKQKEQLQLEKARKALKLQKKKVGDIHKIKNLKTHLEKVEKRQEMLRLKRKVKKQRKLLEPKVLSATKFEDPDLEFNLGRDISGNLRNLKREGNLLTDRFKSLQKRNILEPSKRAHHKRGKVKKFIRPGHKEDWEKTVARDRK